MKNKILPPLILLFLTACSPSTPTSSPTITPTNTHTSVPPTVTVSPSPSKTISNADSFLTKIFIPSSTPTPSFADFSEDVQVQIKELLETNGNCDYPCWWGIMPGESIFEDARLFIEQLAIQSWIHDTEFYEFTASIAVPVSFNRRGYLYFGMMREDESEIAKVLSVSGYEMSMTDILKIFGEPSEVHFDSPLMFPTNIVQFSLDLYYPDKGIIIFFNSATETPDPHNIINICDLDTQFWSSTLTLGGLSFWYPLEYLTFEEVFNLSLWSDWPLSISIEQISNMDPHSFYLNFSQPNPDCLEIDTFLFGSQTD